MKRAGFTLVVDDNEGVRTSLGALLESNGHSVATAKDIQEALQQLESGIPELLICDYMLEGETSFRLTQAEVFSSIPTRILLTGNGLSELDSDVVSRFTDVVSKSDGSTELMDAISKSRVAVVQESA